MVDAHQRFPSAADNKRARKKSTTKLPSENASSNLVQVSCDQPSFFDILLTDVNREEAGHIRRHVWMVVLVAKDSVPATGEG